MHELVLAVASVLADFLNVIEWDKANDFMSFVKTTLEACLLVAKVPDKNDNKKGE